MKKAFSLLAVICLIFGTMQAQGLLDELETATPADSTSAPFPSSFETVRLVNGHSTELPGKNGLQFMITHRFGALNGGAYELFGLDQAFMRFGFEYGITDRIGIGIGRTNIGKTYDGHLKVKLLKQSEQMPLSLVWFSATAINSLKWVDPNHVNNRFSHRMSYTHQLLLSSRIADFLSVQVMPTLVHRNLSPIGELNDVFLCGLGASVKINTRNAINVEYYPFVANKPAGKRGSLALGWDLETGGHVFQITLSNSRAMTDNLFLTETTGNWLDGGIHLGFNLMRYFQVGRG